MRSVSLALALALLPSIGLAASAGDPGSAEPRVPVVGGPGILVHSSSSSAAAPSLARAVEDTFVLYGGPDHPTEGKFQLEDGDSPDWGGGNGLPGGYGGAAGAWSPVDLTYLPLHWHQDSFNAANLNDNGEGNLAMWCGVTAGDPEAASWETPPGYGNNWNDVLLYESAPVSDPSLGQTLTLDFFFNHDTEPGYDFFTVEFDSAGTWTTLYAIDASNADTAGVFHPPGIQYATLGAPPINYSGNDYSGDDADRIRIRLRFESDGGWSDEDGFWPTLGGAVQVDDISLVTPGGTLTEDFEGSPPFLFNPVQAPFGGNFADIFPQFSDPDPCRYADSPVAGFLDYGQVVRNGPGVDGAVSTGGSTTPGIDYGIPGSFVFNYTGGLSFGEVSVINEIWSPDIAWDLPGADDDDPDVAGSFLRFSVWNDLPVINGIFFAWHVRSALPAEDYENWQDRNFVYHGTGTGYWSNQRFDTTDLIQGGAERVQLALGGWDYASIFGFPGTAATPSPMFDNVAFVKYRVAGPAFATRNIDLAQDGFPVSGSVDVSTPASRDALDVPFSMARDVNSGDVVNSPGDSVIVDVAAVIPGTEVTDTRMVWALRTNALFEDAIRAAPARARDQNVVAGAAGTIWTGEVVAQQSTTSSGAVVNGRFFVDLPDADFLYPGDVLQYYIQGTDSEGRVSSLPADLTDFGVFGPGTRFDRTFTVRALPSVVDEAGDQPSILVINDFGRRGNEAEFTTAFTTLGMDEGTDYDTYTVQGPSSMVSNGIGSSGAHGATAAQLAGYEYIFYLAGNLSNGLLSDGGDPWSGSDKGDDVGVLEAWHALEGPRSVAYFGDYIGTGLSTTQGAFNYLTNTMRVDVLDRDVRDVIGGQVAPGVVPEPSLSQWLSTSFVAFGGCPGIAEFDQIQPLAGAVPGHYFTDPIGVPVTDPQAGVASVVFQSVNGTEITFPFSTMAVRWLAARNAGVSALGSLFFDVLALFDYPIAMCTLGCTDAPETRTALRLEVAPNPFNPSTTVEFSAAPGSRGSVRVYNLRGELVRTLHSGEFREQAFRWDGTDDRGASVASGVYVVRAESGDQRMTRKVALVK